MGMIKNKKLAGLLAYVLMLAVGIAGFLVVLSIGETPELAPAAAAAEIATPPAKVDTLLHVLATLASVMSLGYLLGRLFRFIRQPPVIGEVVAGICLGPSLLGAISPDLMHMLIPSPLTDPQGKVSSCLQVISQVGVILYMFIVGLELNGNKLKHQMHAAVAISHVGIIVPFLLGAVLSIWLHPRYAPEGVAFAGFSLFIGIAMAITAFPVLARILTDRGLESTRLGTVALACAAADDATAWCLLALVVGIVQTQVSAAVWVGITAGMFVAGMFLIVRPLLAAWCKRVDASDKPLAPAVFVFGLVGVLLSAIATEVIGIHAIFGAFLLGAVIPHHSRLARELQLRLKDFVTVFLLPAYFAYTGMRMQVGLVTSAQDWAFCGLIILVATLGKFGGTLAAARATGIGWRDAAALGTLMNTRGLMELIVLNIGLDLGVISPRLFAMMVLMALATTMATSPVLSWLMVDFEDEALPAPSEETSLSA